MKRRPAKTPPPSAFDTKRAELVHRVAAALLAGGVAQIPLRELAAQLGTSDRMLLYYFRDKEQIVRASLTEVSARLAAILGSGLPVRRVSPSTMLNKALPLFTSPAVSPFMIIWSDISARGSRGEEPFRSIARNSVRWWLEWLERRLDIDEAVRRRDMAAALLTILEGARLLEASISSSSKGAIKILSRALDATRST